jgi:hypothetical protein
MRTIFDKLNNTLTKYHSPTEQLAVDDIILLSEDRGVFKQYT